MSDAPQGSDGAAPQRRRLVLKPRDPDAAARLEAERQAHLAKANPFGAAKPREAVIAEKLGKTEEEVLKEEVSKEKLHLRLSGAQLEEKRQAEAELKEAQEMLEVEEDAGRKAELRAELAARQQKLDALMESFAKVTLETALSGSAPRVSQIRQQQQLQQEQTGYPAQGGAAGYAAGGARYAAGAQPGGYPNATGGASSFGGREFNEPRQGGGGGAGGGRGFRNYQQRGGFTDSYQPERQGSGNYGRRGGSGRLPEWALDDANDAGFYDAPAATSAFIAGGGYPGGGGGGSGSYGGGGYGGGGYSGGGGGDGRGRGGGRGGRGRSQGNGSYGAGYSSGRGLGGEFEYQEEASYGSGQDRF